MIFSLLLVFLTKQNFLMVLIYTLFIHTVLGWISVVLYKAGWLSVSDDLYVQCCLFTIQTTVFTVCGPLSAAVVASAAATALCRWLLYCCCCCCCCTAALLMLLILGRAVVCSTVLSSLGIELATATLALANQQLSLLGRPCLTRPIQDSVAASLSLVRTLIHCWDEDL